MQPTVLADETVLDNGTLERRLVVEDMPNGDDIRVRLHENRVVSSGSDVSLRAEWTFDDATDAAEFWYEQRVFGDAREAAKTAFLFSDLGYSVTTPPAQKLIGFADDESLESLLDGLETTIEAGEKRAATHDIQRVHDTVTEHEDMLRAASASEATALVKAVKGLMKLASVVWEDDTDLIQHHIEAVRDASDWQQQTDHLVELEAAVYSFADSYVQSLNCSGDVRNAIDALDGTDYITDDIDDESCPTITIDSFNQADRGHYEAMYQVLHAERYAARLRNARQRKTDEHVVGVAGRT